MTSYDTYQRHSGKSPDLTSAPLYIADSRRLGGSLELSLSSGAEVLPFRVDRIAILSEERIPAFLTDMEASKVENLKGKTVVCSIDRKTGTIYSLTPNLVAL